MKKHWFVLTAVVAMLAAFALSCGGKNKDKDNPSIVAPEGTTGSVTLDSDAYSSYSATMTITLKDADLTATTATVAVSSTSDPTGISVTLSGAAGTYSGTVGFTSDDSSAGTLHVEDADTITASYADAMPAGTRTATATWSEEAVNPVGTVTLDSNSYTGYDTVMTISVADVDLTGPTVDVTVTSTADSIGIIITLAGSSGNYSGTVGFTNDASGNNKIYAEHNDTVTVSYSDESPAGTRTDTAIWTDGIDYEALNAQRFYMYTDGPFSIDGLRDMDVFSSTVDLAPTTDEHYDGSESLTMTVLSGKTWGGFALRADASDVYDITVYTNIYIALMVPTGQGITDVKVQFADWKSGAAHNSTMLSCKAYDSNLLDGEWHLICIPVTDFNNGTFDPQYGWYLPSFILNSGTIGAGDHIFIDSVYFQ